LQVTFEKALLRSTKPNQQTRALYKNFSIVLFTRCYGSFNRLKYLLLFLLRFAEQIKGKEVSLSPLEDKRIPCRDSKKPVAVAEIAQMGVFQRHGTRPHNAIPNGALRLALLWSEKQANKTTIFFLTAREKKNTS
jgi:hypothetical protein